MRDTAQIRQRAHAIAALLALALWVVPAWSQERVALLLGNGGYRAPGLELENPVNDVTALAAVLATEGFDTTALTDQSSAGMERAITAFADKATGADIALFFYAGHGVQAAGENFLVGVEFEGADIAGLEAASVRLSDVRHTLEQAGADLSMLVIDACRDTPFAERGLTSPGLRRESGGLGSLIAYATDPGNVALDGAGKNSVFTAALLEHIDTPGLDVRLMLGRVRQQVVMETGGRQVPWVEEAVIGEHVLSTEPAADAQPPDPEAEEIRLWRRVSAGDDATSYKQYLARYPRGLFAEIATARAGEAVAAPGDVAPRAVSLDTADPTALAAALSTLGLLHSGEGNPSTTTLARAFDTFRSRQPDPVAAAPDDLYREAGRYAAFLAAATAQRLRTDLVALRSVERTLGIAEDALAQMEVIAAGDETALPVLTQARSDVVAIRESRKAILRRLDLSRGYYADLLDSAAAFMPNGATIDLLGGIGDTRSTVNPARGTLEDARHFLDHVAQAQDTQNGSYQWLKDYLPGT